MRNIQHMIRVINSYQTDEEFCSEISKFGITILKAIEEGLFTVIISKKFSKSAGYLLYNGFFVDKIDAIIQSNNLQNIRILYDNIGVDKLETVFDKVKLVDNINDEIINYFINRILDSSFEKDKLKFMLKTMDWLVGRNKYDSLVHILKIYIEYFNEKNRHSVNNSMLIPKELTNNIINLLAKKSDFKSIKYILNSRYMEIVYDYYGDNQSILLWKQLTQENVCRLYSRFNEKVAHLYPHDGDGVIWFFVNYNKEHKTSGNRDAHILETAMKSNRMDVVSYLLNNGVGANLCNGKFLHMAVTCRNNDAIKILLDAGADININNGMAFREAILNDDIETAKFLHKNGAEVVINKSELLNLVDDKKINTLKFLVMYGFDITEYVNELYVMSIQKNAQKIREFLELFESEKFVPSIDKLYEAIETNQISLVKFLLDAGVDVHFNREEPLRKAVDRKNPMIIELLSDYGADVRVKSPEILKILLDAGEHEIMKKLLERMRT